MEIIRLIGIGIILGVANVIPGVSGGTMAVVFGVYERLIGVITFNVKKILAEWKFVLPLFGGMAAGIILFSKFITFLFENYPVQTNWFFIGIIAGSIPMICGRIRVEQKNAGGGKGLAVSIAVCVAVMFALMVATVVFRPEDAGQTIETALSARLAALLFLGAMAAAVAMIIPGISGSFLMLVLGIYSTVIAAVSGLNIPLLIPVALGVGAGLLIGAKIIRLLMEKVPAQTYGAILGLVAGSIMVIFPGPAPFPVLAVSACCLAAGFAVSYFSARAPA